MTVSQFKRPIKTVRQPDNVCVYCGEASGTHGLVRAHYPWPCSAVFRFVPCPNTPEKERV